MYQAGILKAIVKSLSQSSFKISIEGFNVSLRWCIRLPQLKPGSKIVQILIINSIITVLKHYAILFLYHYMSENIFTGLLGI